MADCIFCKIAKREIESRIVHESEDVVAFEDLNPKAPVHILIIPRKHVESVLDLGREDAQLALRLLQVAGELARERGIAERGFRLVANAGAEAGQSVPHLHLHLLGGRGLGWPPG
jgi:histidine triad (HIT) family protein